jgi:D-arabinose 1-dehydrogenase-like Zn-dependent alcohol dehydrogenase
MGITAGDVVAVQGLGGLGHLAVQFIRKMGYRTVALSTSDSKKDFAMELGANDFINTSNDDAVEALQKMGGASLVVVTAPNPQLMGPLVKACGPMGKVLILARKFSPEALRSRCHLVADATSSSRWRHSS